MVEIMNKYKQLQLLVKNDKKDDKSLDYCMRILDDTVEDKGDLIYYPIQIDHYTKQIYHLIIQAKSYL